ncbi:unnamed protein product [[Candida] boidinii]|nr:unnamed protein product [[Candida] boidinii]
MPHLRTNLGEWNYDRQATGFYLDTLEKGAVNGISYKGKHVLITGAGKGSIGAEVLQGLISGGAKVVVTTSRFSKQVTEYYQTMYSRFGASGSTLVVVPFNQGSKQDVEALVNFIYDDVKKGGLGWDLDGIIPFAAIPENGVKSLNKKKLETFKPDQLNVSYHYLQIMVLSVLMVYTLNQRLV